MLHRNGIDAKVGAVRVLFSKELHVSVVHRLAIEYSKKSDHADRPRTLFLKLSKRNYLSGFEPGDIDRPEVEFYSELATRIGCPPLIRCYDAAFDEASSRSHLLMEDLMDTHSQPSQKCAPSAELSRSAVQALAKVHRAWWNQSISDLGFPNSDCAAAETNSSVFANNARRFDAQWLGNFAENLTKNVAEFAEVVQLTGKQRDMYTQMLEAAPKIWGRLLDPVGLTVTHGDLHWWNFLYPNDAGVDSVRLFDWQLWHIDLGARDLAFLLALGGFAEPRPSMEEELLRAYHEALDLKTYSWEMLMHDYRSSAIRNLNIPIIFWKQRKHYSTWQDALRRASDAYMRLDCDELY